MISKRELWCEKIETKKSLKKSWLLNYFEYAIIVGEGMNI